MKLKNLKSLKGISGFFFFLLFLNQANGEEFSLEQENDQTKKTFQDYTSTAEAFGEDFLSFENLKNKLDDIHFSLDGEYSKGLSDTNEKVVTFTPSLRGKKNRWLFDLRFELIYDRGFKTYTTRYDYLRIIEKLEYNGLPNSYFSIGRIKSQTLGFGMFVENYSNDLERNYWIPGATGYSKHSFLELNALTSNISRAQILATRIQLDGTNYILRPIFGLEYATDFHAPHYVEKNDIRGRPTGTTKVIIAKSIDLSVGILQNTLRPFVQLGKLNNGKAIGFGVKHAKKYTDFKFESHLEGRNEQDKYLPHYFDGKYEAEKYDYFISNSNFNAPKARYLEELNNEWHYGLIFKEKITFDDVAVLNFGGENRQGHEKGEGFAELSLSLNKHLDLDLKYQKNRLDQLLDFVKNDQRSLYEIGLNYTQNGKNIGLKLYKKYFWNTITNEYEKEKEILLGGGLAIPL